MSILNLLLFRVLIISTIRKRVTSFRKSNKIKFIFILNIFQNRIAWCSGYHICLTHRRSQVRALVRSIFYIFIFKFICYIIIRIIIMWNNIICIVCPYTFKKITSVHQKFTISPPKSNKKISP